MKQAHEKYAKDGLVVLGFNSDEAAEKMNEYITKNDYDWSQWFMGDGLKKLQNKYWVSGYPTNFLVGRDGKIITRSIRLGHGNGEEIIKAALQQGGNNGNNGDRGDGDRKQR